MSEQFTAPCVGGPAEGSLLPYTEEDRHIHPTAYIVYHSDHPRTRLGEYRFIRAGQERRGTGDTWRWHPFIGSIK